MGHGGKTKGFELARVTTIIRPSDLTDMDKSIREAEQFKNVVNMQEQIAIFYDPKATEYCTNEQDRRIDSKSNVSKEMRDKHFYESTYKKVEDEISRRDR